MINGSHISTYILPLFDKPGTFLEIGCWQGTHYSQSKELEDKGWTGICVDPFPSGFENRKCRLINKAVSKDGKPREFVKYSGTGDAGEMCLISPGLRIA